MAHRISLEERIAKMDTACWVCGASLYNTQSVEYGIGPICREKTLGFSEMDESARAEVGRYVQEALAARFKEVRGGVIFELAKKIRDCGYSNVADKVVSNFIDIRVETIARNRMAISSPYSKQFVLGAREIGGRWDRERKVWTFPVNDDGDKRGLWTLIRQAYEGLLMDIDNGAKQCVVPAYVPPGC